MREPIPATLNPGKYWYPLYERSYKYEHSTIQIICTTMRDEEADDVFYVYLDAGDRPALDGKLFTLTEAMAWTEVMVSTGAV
jgi:hypothetical protein